MSFVSEAGYLRELSLRHVHDVFSSHRGRYHRMNTMVQDDALRLSHTQALSLSHATLRRRVVGLLSAYRLLIPHRLPRYMVPPWIAVLVDSDCFAIELRLIAECQ